MPDESRFWAEFYNAEHSLSDNPQKTLMDKVNQHKKMQKLPVQPWASRAIESAVNSGAFDNEMKVTGVDHKTMIEALKNVSKVETAGGAYNKVSSTGAAGLLQVTDGTFRDLLKRNIVGPKALKHIGKTKKELLNMTNDERKDFLTNNADAASIFGLGAYVNKLNSLKGSK